MLLAVTLSALAMTLIVGIRYLIVSGAFAAATRIKHPGLYRGLDAQTLTPPNPSPRTWSGVTEDVWRASSPPITASIGWNAIAAQAVGGRLAWWTACAALNTAGRCIQRCVQ